MSIKALLLFGVLSKMMGALDVQERINGFNYLSQTEGIMSILAPFRGESTDAELCKRICSKTKQEDMLDSLIRTYCSYRHETKRAILILEAIVNNCEYNHTRAYEDTEYILSAHQTDLQTLWSYWKILSTQVTEILQYAIQHQTEYDIDMQTMQRLEQICSDITVEVYGNSVMIGTFFVQLINNIMNNHTEYASMRHSMRDKDSQITPAYYPAELSERYKDIKIFTKQEQQELDRRREECRKHKLLQERFESLKYTTQYWMAVLLYGVTDPVSAGLDISDTIAQRGGDMGLVLGHIKDNMVKVNTAKVMETGADILSSLIAALVDEINSITTGSPSVLSRMFEQCGNAYANVKNGALAAGKVVIAAAKSVNIEVSSHTVARDTKAVTTVQEDPDEDLFGGSPISPKDIRQKEGSVQPTGSVAEID